jgi:hypothetical protein
MITLPTNKIGDGLFNVGSGKSLRVIDMVELIQLRFTELMGYVPEIMCPQPALNERSSNLDYRINKLLNTGFTLRGNPVLEIDQTLRMCSQFGLSGS